jgi:hypothetical protein
MNAPRVDSGIQIKDPMGCGERASTRLGFVQVTQYSQLKVGIVEPIERSLFKGQADTSAD